MNLDLSYFELQPKLNEEMMTPQAGIETFFVYQERGENLYGFESFYQVCA